MTEQKRDPYYDVLVGACSRQTRGLTFEKQWWLTVGCILIAAWDVFWIAVVVFG